MEHTSRPHNRHRHGHSWILPIIMVTAATALAADTPGRGRTAAFEAGYLTFIINHHASALRMTELAAGTDTVRRAMHEPDEGTAPTPGFPSTSAKATMTEIKSMSRMANRAQREEIARAQRMLKDWYGVQHQPVISADGQRLIRHLEETPAGREFDRAFLVAFSTHHYGALQSSIDCQVNRDPQHEALDRYCRGIVHTQLNEIAEMREMLCKQFGVCDLQLPQ